MTINKIEFDDNTSLTFGKGNFNEYQILYHSNKGSERINGKTYLNRIKNFAVANKDCSLNRMNSIIDEIATINEIDTEKLDNIVKKYEMKPNINWKKTVYLMSLMFYAEDQRLSVTIMEEILRNRGLQGRNMYISETKRIAILGEDVSSVYEKYNNNKGDKHLNEIMSLIEETNSKVEIKLGHQKTIDEWFLEI